MKKLKLAVMVGIMTMIFSAIWLTLYDKIVEGYVNTKFLALTSLLGFISGVCAYFSILITGATVHL